MAAATLGYERPDGAFPTVPDLQFGAPTDPQLHIRVWYNLNEVSMGYAMPDVSATDSPREKEEPKVLKNFRTAIQRALVSIGSDNLDNALLAMWDIDSAVLLKMQEQFLPDPGTIEGQNQKMHSVKDRTFWQQFNICWLAFGQRILDFHCNLNSPPDRLIQLVESAGRSLIAIGDDLEEWGLVDYEMGMWEEEILDSK
ncbi:hypothetical protein CNMCM8927_003571 [Aspergillus lentulus]|uniref:Uncharacterized protein n=1 Tax=Aspergillus lentulus TaxID=293939 RepID=A0AAN6BRU4_ASPLE|nr:hypothetical protein CNMCM8927_003571 [Aspergillus lentulus]